MIDTKAPLIIIRRENKDCSDRYVCNVGAMKSRAETIAFIGNTDDNVTVSAFEGMGSEIATVQYGKGKMRLSFSSHVEFIPRMYLSFGDVMHSRNSSATRYGSRTEKLCINNSKNTFEKENFLSESNNLLFLTFFSC